MSKFEGHQDHAGFLAMKDELTHMLASAIEIELRQMGDSAKGISWFSSCAQEYAPAGRLKAA